MEALELVDVLREESLVSDADLGRALDEQKRSGRPLGRILIDLKICTETQLVGALATILGYEFVDLKPDSVDPVTASLVPDALARRHLVVPLQVTEDGGLVVAMSDPSNIVALDDLRTLTGRDILPVVATREAIQAALENQVRLGESVQDIAGGLDDEEVDEDLDSLKRVVEDAPIVKFVNAMIAQAVGDRASDIHVEPQEKELRIRYRIDGVLHEVLTRSRKIHSAVVSRLKIMSDMDIAEKRMPQDGRISVRAGGKEIDLRVSSLPTVHGEKVVMRILDKTSVLLSLADLGFLEDNFRRYEESYRKPYGMILVTGPTGSGKSTTLYATLNVISNPEINIITTEDPVEYRLAGISQVQMNPKAGLTFPRALRSILRQDPDVVLVGEMRDHETAQIGMEAALTGHLVLSTLHTNDAPSAVTRLTEMGIEPFLVGSAVDCVLAQRLARRLCKECREPFTPTQAQLTAAGLAVEDLAELPTIYRAIGCSSCSSTGYRGRLALHEVMQVTEEIERMIVERASTDDIAKSAHAQGMRTLREDGLAKVLLGQTTIEEIARVVV